MAIETLPITPRGMKLLQDKLQQLKSVERPKNVRDIETARELGDLSENAEYHAAKERQGMIDAQIKDTEARLARAQVVDPSKLSGSKVTFGATVELEDANSGDSFTYQIVGGEEADAKAGLISYATPIARALIGKEEGDEVTIQTPGKSRTVVISKVSFK
jgi:transcription elongation factor GreA